MLNTYLKYYFDAKAKNVKEQISVADLMNKYIILQDEFNGITDDILEYILTIYYINTEKKNTETSTESSNNTNNTPVVEHFNKNQTSLIYQDYNNITTEICKTCLQFIKDNCKNNRTYNDDVDSNLEFITNTNLKLETLLNEIETENITNKLYIVDILSYRKCFQDHIIDAVYKFNCFYYNVKTYTKILKYNAEKLIATDIGANNFDYSLYKKDLSIYTRKTNTLYDYIEYMTQKVFIIEEIDECIIDGDFRKQEKSIIAIRSDKCLNVFAYNPINALPPIAERKKSEKMLDKTKDASIEKNTLKK